MLYISKYILFLGYISKRKLKKTLKGYAYYAMKNVTKDNEKAVLSFLNGNSIFKRDLVKFFDKLKEN